LTLFLLFCFLSNLMSGAYCSVTRFVLPFNRFYSPHFTAVCWIHWCSWFYSCCPMVYLVWPGAYDSSMLWMANYHKGQRIKSFTKDLSYTAHIIHFCCCVSLYFHAPFVNFFMGCCISSNSTCSFPLYQ